MVDHNPPRNTRRASCATPAPTPLPARTTEVTVDPAERQLLVDEQWDTTGESGGATTAEFRYYHNDGRQRTKLRGAGGSSETANYTYDRNGNRAGDERGTHEYNSRDQLVQWRDSKTPQSATSYVLDGAGAIQQKTTTGPTPRYTANYYADGELACSVNTTSPVAYTGSTADCAVDPAKTLRYRHDAFGSMTCLVVGNDASACDSPSAIKIRYDYDPFERLTASRQIGQSEDTVYDYDGLDRRDRKLEDGVARDYGYVGLTEQLSREGTSTGAKLYEYTAHGDRLAQITATSAGASTWRNLSRDANGSVVAIEDPISGRPRTTADGKSDRYELDPYGQVLNEAALTPEAKDQPFRFHGHYYDTKVATYDMQARAYRPDISRFLTQDRYEQAGADLQLQADPLTSDRYVFTAGNPVTRRELDGHISPDAVDLNNDRARRADRNPSRGRVAPVSTFDTAGRFRRSARLQRQLQPAGLNDTRGGVNADLRQAARHVRAEALRRPAGNLLDAAGGASCGLIGACFFGDQQSKAYRSGERAGTVVGFAGTLTGVGGIVRTGAKAGIKRLAGQQTDELTDATRGVTHAIPEGRLGHIFRDAPGHLADTPANRKLLQGVADDPATTLGADKFGNTWSARTLDDGTQVWTQTRNGDIINGGLNPTPRPFNPQTGLSRQQPPRNR